MPSVHVDPLALIDAALATAVIDGLSRESIARLREIRDAFVCATCVRVAWPGGSVAVMPADALSDLRARIQAVADDLEDLVARPPADPRDLAARLAADAAELRAIGGPTDPT